MGGKVVKVLSNMLGSRFFFFFFQNTSTGLYMDSMFSSRIQLGLREWTGLEFLSAAV